MKSLKMHQHIDGWSLTDTMQPCQPIVGNQTDLGALLPASVFRMGHPVPLLRNVAATGCFGFERHGRGPSVREGAIALYCPAPDANRLIRATRWCCGC